MELSRAQAIAENLVEVLRPHCDRIEIAGSVRRQKPEVKDIEIVAIPKPYDVGLFESGIASVVNQWPKVRGELPCKYTQRQLSEGIALDLFFTTPDNWGLIYAIRTGSAAYSHKVLATGWSRMGYRSEGGVLHRELSGETVSFAEEEDLFNFLGLDWVEPSDREVTA